MKKFWWGLFFGALIGVLLLLPESNFSNRVRGLFYTTQYAAIDIVLAIFAYSTFLGVVALWVINSYGKPYLARKAENLATKQDIGDITKLTEEVKIEFDRQREEYKTKNTLRLAVLEKRFEVHQQAYSFWVKINLLRANLNDVSFKTGLFNWWKSNALYLDPAPRRAVVAMIQAHLYITENFKGDLLPGDDDIEVEPMSNEEAINAIEAAGPIIEKAVGLPQINTPMKSFKKYIESESTDG